MYHFMHEVYASLRPMVVPLAESAHATTCKTIKIHYQITNYLISIDMLTLYIPVISYPPKV